MIALASLTESARKIALDRFRLLQPYLEEKTLLKAVARNAGIGYRTVQRREAVAYLPTRRYSNLFWALPDKHIYMAVGYHGQVIMVFPDFDVVAVTTGRGKCPLSKFADLISSSVKSDMSLPADAAGAKLLAKDTRCLNREASLKPI